MAVQEESDKYGREKAGTNPVVLDGNRTQCELLACRIYREIHESLQR